jgi:magnesium transporter
MTSTRTTYGPGGAFAWVNLVEPEPDELVAAEREFGLPGPVVDYLRAAAKRPTLEVFGPLLFAVVKTVGYVPAEAEVTIGEVQLVVGPDFVVTVDRDETVLEAVAKDLQSNPELARLGPAAVLHGVVDQAVETYGPVLHALNEAVEEVEDIVFAPVRKDPTERIYDLSREVLECRRATVPLGEVLERLGDEPYECVPDELRTRFREERAHLLHLVEVADGLGSLLANILQANLTQVSVRQNDDMRRISAWVAIWAVPTLIAGIYGMNFAHMPELDWTWGYPLAVVVMAAICVVLYRVFRRTGWL